MNDQHKPTHFNTTESFASEHPATEKPPKHSYETREKLLILIALVIGLLFDRLLFAKDFFTSFILHKTYAVFWLSYLAIFYAYHWKAIKKNLPLWCIAMAAAALCLWNFFFFQWDFLLLNVLVIPAVLMTHAQLFTYQIRPKELFKAVCAWFGGWFIAPFNAIHHFFGICGGYFHMEKRPRAKGIGLGLLLSALLLCIILPLLTSADQAFAYFLDKLIVGFNPAEILLHIIFIAISGMLFFSFFWNSGHPRASTLAAQDSTGRNAFKLDHLVLCIMVSVLLLVYTLFCSVQFTYLFAQAGLPMGMTYADYARQGFAQMVAICSLNLLFFGFCMFSDQKSKVMTGLLLALLVATAIILLSGLLRLNLYIGAYGMTWLRLLSAWFIIYLAVVIALCVVRLFRQKLPVVYLCGMLLLFWFVALGYANPSRLITIL